MPRYRIKLTGFNFTQHTWRDESVHVAPERDREGRCVSTAVLANTWELEALSIGDAKERFKETMGINSTTETDRTGKPRWEIEELEPEETPKKGRARKAG